MDHNYKGMSLDGERFYVEVFKQENEKDDTDLVSVKKWFADNISPFFVSNDLEMEDWITFEWVHSTSQFAASAGNKMCIIPDRAPDKHFAEFLSFHKELETLSDCYPFRPSHVRSPENYGSFGFHVQALASTGEKQYYVTSARHVFETIPITRTDHPFAEQHGPMPGYVFCEEDHQPANCFKRFTHVSSDLKGIIGRHMLYTTPDEDELLSTFVDFAIAKVDARPLRFPNEPEIKLFTGDLQELIGTSVYMVGATSGTQLGIVYSCDFSRFYNGVSCTGLLFVHAPGDGSVSFAQPGDSGAAVFKRVGHKELLAVGTVFEVIYNPIHKPSYATVVIPLKTSFAACSNRMNINLELHPLSFNPWDVVPV